MTDEHTLQLTPPSGQGRSALEQQVVQLAGYLVGRLGREYEVSSDEVVARASSWQQTITVRKGSKIGADIDVSWDGDKMWIETDTASTFGTMLVLLFAMPLAAAGVLFGYAHIGPFAMLPGRRIAAVIAGVVLMIPGVLVGMLLNKLLSRGALVENTKLLETLRAELRTYPGAG